MATKVEKLSVSITTVQAEAIREAVKEGAYASTSDAIRDALRLWTEKRQARAQLVEKARRLWDDGIASGFSEAEPMTEIIAKVRDQRAKQG